MVADDGTRRPAIRRQGSLALLLLFGRPISLSDPFPSDFFRSGLKFLHALPLQVEPVPKGLHSPPERLHRVSIGGFIWSGFVGVVGPGTIESTAQWGGRQWWQFNMAQ
jgi:hypothetical protein